MLIPFSKMQAQGNDFVILELLDTQESRLNLPELVLAICDRRTGVGADGLVLLLADTEADARMVIFNSDGSRAAMCGSALRCCADLIHGIHGLSEMRIATDSGIKSAAIHAEYGNRTIEVNLGTPLLIEENITVDTVPGNLVNIGNLHYVSFWQQLQGQEALHGEVIEKHQHFTEEVNSEYVRVIDRGQIEMTVWERGCGATQACGTGAVASVFSGIHKGLLDSQVTVRMPGGEVRIEALSSGEYLLSGGVEHVFTGVFVWKT